MSSHFFASRLVRRPIVRLSALAGLLFFGALGGVVQATTLLYRTDAELASLADRVIRGRVLDSRAERQPGSGVVLTVTRIAVLEDLTGGQEPVIEVRELGGVADEAVMWVPGAPRFVPGQEVVLCLEAWRGAYRSLAMSFSAFIVERSGADAAATPATLRRMEGEYALVGGPGPAAGGVRTLDDFRTTVFAVKGARAVSPALPANIMAALGASASGAPVFDEFTRLGNLRWRQADTDTPVVWYRNPDFPSPLTSGSINAEIQTALAAWTNPTTARIQLTFGGTRSHPGALTEDTVCDSANSGVGIITFDDPGDYLTGSTLAVGGGCGGGSLHAIAGVSYTGFSHGFVVFNELSGSYTSAPNFTRVLTHEIGHGIGLGHTTTTTDLMYPSCCFGSMPVPPAIGPDDLAGVSAIYPMPSAPACTYSINPTAASYSGGGGTGSVGVTASAQSCAWNAASNSGFVTVTAGAAGTGSGTVSYHVAINTGGARAGTLTIANHTFTVSQQPQVDSDSDGLPDWWEEQFGLSTSSGSGVNGPSGDPDGDGRNNGDEYVLGTHPRGLATRYLAEGAINTFFQTEIAILNPNPSASTARVLVRIQPQDQPERNTYLTVPAHTRRTLTASDLSLFTSVPFSTVIESDVPVVVDRTMSWDATGYGSHAETAIESPSTTWYLAEGSTSGDFALFYLLQNPNSAQTSATVRFLRPAPLAPIELTYLLPPNSRTSIAVDGADPGLASTDVSGVVTSTLPIIVERSMYLSRPGQPFAAGHESAGVTAPAPTWFLAEGATGGFFELFLLIANPSTNDSQVAVDYLLPNGSTLTKSYTVAGNSRFSIWVDEEQLPAGSGIKPLADTSLAMRVRTTNNVPIIVERAMWWPQPGWYEAHNAVATTVTGTRWALAGGELGGASDLQTYVLIANTSSVAGQAQVTLYFEDSTSATTTVNVAGNSRTNVSIGATFPIAANRRFGIVVESSGAPLPQLVVERAMYSNPGGVLWGAGTAAVATRLSP